MREWREFIMWVGLRGLPWHYIPCHDYVIFVHTFMLVILHANLRQVHVKGHMCQDINNIRKEKHKWINELKCEFMKKCSHKIVTNPWHIDTVSWEGVSVLKYHLKSGMSYKRGDPRTLPERFGFWVPVMFNFFFLSNLYLWFLGELLVH